MIDEYPTSPVLPEDQRATVNLVRRMARERGVPVEVVDLGKTRPVLKRKMVREQGWTDFPVLATSSGRPLVGPRAFGEQAPAPLFAEVALNRESRSRA